MDYPPAEGPGVTLLGEHHPGHVGRAVHGGRGDLWGGGVHPLPGTGTTITNSPLHDGQKLNHRTASVFSVETSWVEI